MPATAHPDTWLPALLIGQPVRMNHLRGEVGIITEVGHAYGPGTGQDQARVQFSGEHSWHYLTALIFPDPRQPPPPPPPPRRRRFSI